MNWRISLSCFLLLCAFQGKASDTIRIEKVIKEDWGAIIHFPPVHEDRLPVIVTLGGAEGGLSFVDEEANLMAKEGFIVMRLGFFKFSKETLKQNLQEIRIEKVTEALKFLNSKPNVDSTKIALLGISKGAELALLVASQNRDIKAVVAHLPSHVVWYGLGKWKGLNESSWSYQGKPLPFVPYAKPKSGWFTKRIAEFYEAGLEKNADKVPEAIIKVENISGPILLTSGGKDDVWPSLFMADQIEKRLKSKQFGYDVKHLHFPDAGHGIFGKLPDPNDTEAMQGLSAGGGSPEANFKARQETWAETFKFLNHTLKGHQK
jgi:uncharacterized protein